MDFPASGFLEELRAEGHDFPRPSSRCHSETVLKQTTEASSPGHRVQDASSCPKGILLRYVCVYIYMYV